MALWGIHSYVVYTEVEEAKKLLILEYDKKMLEAENKAKEELSFFVIEQQKATDEKNNEISILTERVSSLNRMLQQRESRDKDNGSSIVTGSCTGRELYREDGGFLAGEAARAERIRIERDYYYEQYEKLRQMIKRTNKK